MARLEAVLLMAEEPLPSRKLAHLANLADGTEARTLLRKLNRLYDQEGCSFYVEEVAGGFQLLSRPKFAPWLRRLVGNGTEVRLSSPALETLAVVAYRQPMLRAEVEAIRGVQCGEILRQLTERDLVRVVGRSDELGRPLLYGTTKRFLQIFGLRNLDQLPQPESLRRSADRDASTFPDHDSDNNDADHPEGRASREKEKESNVTMANPLTPAADEVLGDPRFVDPGERTSEIRDEEVDDDLDYDEYEDEDDEDFDEEEDDDLDDDEDDDDDLEEDDWEEVEDDFDEDDEDLDDDEDDDWDDDDWDEDEDEDEDEDWDE